MIARLVQLAASARFSALANYILDRPHNGQKLEHAWSVNCIQDLELAKIEIEATQRLNTRAKSGKTDHLIISFPEGFHPALDTLKSIETHFCESLGLGNHQRICAVHRDTDNVHMHIAISKINPHTYRIKDPFQSHRRLQKTCRQVEQQYGIAANEKSPDRSTVYEQRHGLVSFQKWLCDNLRPAIKGALGSSTWDELHTSVARFGCSLKRHGKGLVFSHDSEPLHVKASSVDREFALSCLEGLMGTYREPQTSDLPAEKVYEPSPLSASESAQELFAEYKAESEVTREQRAGALNDITRHANEERKLLKEQFKKARSDIRSDKSIDRTARKERLHSMNEDQRARLREITKEANDRRVEVRSQFRKNTWKEWLRDRAQHGDGTALEVLRSSVPKHLDRGNVIAGKERAREHSASFDRDAGAVRLDGGIVNKEGTIIDYGSFIKLRQSDPAAIETALGIARKRFGEQLDVHGSQEFRDHCSSLIDSRQADLKTVPDRSRGRTLRSSVSKAPGSSRDKGLEL